MTTLDNAFSAKPYRQQTEPNLSHCNGVKNTSQKSSKTESAARFNCIFCDYYTNKKCNFDSHLNSIKHKNNAFDNKNNSFSAKPAKSYLCSKCDKPFKDRAGLWRHNKKCCELSCTQSIINGFDKEELIIMLLKQNAELIKGQQQISMEIVRNGTNNITNNTTHTNSHNKAFNLNFFLNETCKNAMNISDFVNSIKLQLNDFINVGEVGFIEGISNIIVKNLNSLDENIRPIHCTDQKRETFYVKDENIWEKDDEQKKKIKNMIKSVAFKNEKLMKVYKETYPDYNDPESKRSDHYSKTVIEAMDCKEESREKIIKNISKVTTINK